jgi:beta-glucanase (GH16 family)
MVHALIYFYYFYADRWSVHGDNLCDFPSPAASVLQPSLQLINKLNSVTKCAEGEKEKRWELVWSDDFKKSGKPDPSKWQFEVGGHGFGTDDDNYATNSIKNAHVQNGHLTIEARKEEFEDQHYTSARLKSVEGWTYGRFEFRAKIPPGRGTWSALWLIAGQQTYGKQQWPDNGEVDVAEVVGHELEHNNHVSIHTKKNNYIEQTQKTSIRSVPDLNTRYHDYALEWLPNRMDIFMDGKLMMSYEKEPGATWEQWPFDQDFHIIMNLTIGGRWATHERNR